MSRLEASQLAIVELLKNHGPMTYAQICEKTGLKSATIEGYILRLRKMKPRAVYLHDVLPNDVGRGTKVWAAGNKKDAPDKVNKALKRTPHAHIPKKEREYYSKVRGPKTLHLQSAWFR